MFRCRVETVERRRQTSVHRRGQTSASAAHEGASGLQVPTEAQTQADDQDSVLVPDAVHRHERRNESGGCRSGPAVLVLGRRIRSDFQRQHIDGDFFARLGQEPPFRIPDRLRITASASVLRHDRSHAHGPRPTQLGQQQQLR